MILPVGFKNFVNFGNGSNKVSSKNNNPHIESPVTSSEKDIFITGKESPVADYIKELVGQGYDYTAACEQADKLSRCLESHQNA